jgi:hypothetical protein
MSANRPDFRRMVLALSHSRPDTRCIDALGELAEMLHLEVEGALLEDPGLRGLPGHAFVRELRSLGAGWQPLDPARLAAEMEQAADAMRRRLAAVFERRRLKARFETVREGAAGFVRSLLQPSDILVLIAPADPADLVSPHFATLADLAFAAAPTILMVPPRVVRTHGPVVALAAGPDDASVAAATAIATAAKEHVLVLETEALPPGRAGLDPARLASRLAGVNERLVVASRGLADGATLAATAALLGVPLLLIDGRRDA